MVTSPLVVFAGGGTGGHLVPGLAVAEQLKLTDKSIRCLFADSGRAVERRILDPTFQPTASIPAPKLSDLKRRPWRFLIQWWRSNSIARRIIQELQPSALVGLGGASSVALAQAAHRSGIPIVLLEQNRIAGRATRFLSRHADHICLSMPLGGSALKVGSKTAVHETGNPIRITKSFPSIRSETQRSLVVTGGSQGATAVNRFVTRALLKAADFFRDWQIFHQAGFVEAEAVRAFYDKLELQATVVDFADDLPSRLRTATLAVSRAGATSLAELSATHCPAIVIPYPHATQDHQSLNAQYYASHGGIVVHPELDTTDNESQFLECLLSCAQDSKRLTRMSTAQESAARPQAAKEVSRIILSCLQR